MKAVKTYCKMCNCRCGILAYVDEGKIVKIKGDPDCQKNDGALCIKGRSMLELLYDEDRLRSPMKKEGESWQEISWEQALSEIAEKLLDLKKKYGPETLGIYRGMSVYSWLIAVYLQRFLNIYGTPNLTSNAALCISSKTLATRFTFGRGVATCGDFRNSKCILLFGTNPAVTGMHRALRVMKDILYAQRNGAKLIVVDPRRTETATKADIYTTIRPGTDTALILALINIIIENNWHDEDFISCYTIGFEELKRAVKEYTPERAEEITWVKKETIMEIARTFALAKPACADRREGVLHHEHGTQTCRAIDILNAVTGNIDVEGGIHLQTKLFDNSSQLFKELTMANKFQPSARSISDDNKVTTNIPTNIIKAVLEEKPYPLRALLVLGSNPVLSWPNSQVVRQALEKLEFLVLIDIYKNDTAYFADYLLPAPIFLEKFDIQAPDVALPKVIQLQQKVIDPIYNSRSEFEIIKDLAVKMGYGQFFSESAEEIAEKILKSWGLSLQELKANESGVAFEPRPVGYYHTHPYPSSSGKIEIYSEKLNNVDFDPIPVFRDSSESPASNTQRVKDYPLVLVSGNRLITTYLSFLHNLPTLHRKTPRNWVEMNPQTANDLGINEGDIVRVESLRGSIDLEAKISEKADPRVVFIPYGWGHYFKGSWQLANSDPGENVNILTDNSYIDKLSGMPNYKSTLCRVRLIHRKGDQMKSLS